MERKELIIDEVATKRLHKQLEKLENMEDILEFLIEKVETWANKNTDNKTKAAAIHKRRLFSLSVP